MAEVSEQTDTRPNGGLLSVGVSWPACKEAMHARARDLAEQGLHQDGIMAVLKREFAGLPSENYYANPAAIELMAHVKRWQPWIGAAKHANVTPIVRASPPEPRPMTPGVVAFAESQGLTCAYCGRTGSRDGDPDGAPWSRDQVPSHFLPEGVTNDLVLACAACRTRADRFEQLASVEV